MRSILVYADRSETMTARLQSALSLARTMEGHVSVLVDTPVARYLSVDALGGSYLAADAVRDAVDRDDTYAQEIAAHLKQDDVPFDILRGEEEPVDALAEAARLADVIVLSRESELVGQLVVTGRAPLLLVPGTTPLITPFERVALAWDGSDESAAALRSALPLLQKASSVAVLTVGEKAASFPALDALQYLSRHDVSAEEIALQRVGSIEESLAGGVARFQADLLVMGAYGHSRLREFLLGGVTRYFLELKDGPALLFAH